MFSKPIALDIHINDYYLGSKNTTKYRAKNIIYLWKIFNSIPQIFANVSGFSEKKPTFVLQHGLFHYSRMVLKPSLFLCTTALDCRSHWSRIQKPVKIKCWFSKYFLLISLTIYTWNTFDVKHFQKFTKIVCKYVKLSSICISFLCNLYILF